MHTPTPDTGWQVAGEGQPPVPGGVQIKAQYVGWDAPFTSRAHSGSAVAPDGAAGHEPSALHGGEQNAPGTPVTVTFNSFAAQDVVYGSSYAPAKSQRKLASHMRLHRFR